MRGILFAALLLTGCSFALIAQTRPKACFDTQECDLGRFCATAGRQKCRFKVTNRGNAPLVIVKVSTGCGCTRATFPQSPIMQGKSGVIEVEYDARQRGYGRFSKRINVYTNDSARVVPLYIKGEAMK